MPECDYCGEFIEESSESDEDDQPFLTHLAEEHTDELSRIDELKIKKQWDGDLDDVQVDESRYSALTLAVAAAGIVFVVGVLAVSAAGWATESPDDGDEPVDGGEWVYEQGTIDIQVNGETVDVGELGGTDRFYIEDGSEIWRMNVPSDERLVVSEALATLGILENIDGEFEVSSDHFNGEDDVDIDLTVILNGETASMEESIGHGDRIEVTLEEESR